MKNILAFNGSPRKKGNTASLLKSFTEGTAMNGVVTEEIFLEDANIKFCQGCLRCNILGYCSLRDDDWHEISAKIEEADVLVFATPIYFHHVTAQMKQMLDRFRSFIKIRMTEEGLEHTPRLKWQKDIVLLLVMGSSDDADADPVTELFRFMIEIMGNESKLHIIKGTRLAVTGQILMNEVELAALYSKLGLNTELAQSDAAANSNLLEQTLLLGSQLSK